MEEKGKIGICLRQWGPGKPSEGGLREAKWTDNPSQTQVVNEQTSHNGQLISYACSKGAIVR
eukprot:1556753-Amphidinium_carterae.1